MDPQRQYVFVVNHQSNFDIPVLVQALPKFQLRWIAKKELLMCLYSVGRCGRRSI